jgi:serine/threonine-protein kinase HipA
VQDLCRQGALRFCAPGTKNFLGSELRAAPPLTTLRELATVATALSSRQIDDLDALRQWLAVLVAPGASLGGARPKANFTDDDGSLWIGKFPARDDERDTGAWEMVAHRLASQAGIVVPPARLVRWQRGFHTFCVQRFDRQHGTRRFYASAMTVLRAAASEGHSYLELAQFLRASGQGAQVAADLEQLFRRVVFNVAIGNRDDHLRNHGFLLGQTGWQLAPAFDMNPSIDKAQHVLNLDQNDNHPSVATVANTAGYYGLDAARAQEIIEEVLRAVAGWAHEARALRLAKAEIALMEAAFVVSAR